MSELDIVKRWLSLLIALAGLGFVSSCVDAPANHTATNANAHRVNSANTWANAANSMANTSRTPTLPSPQPAKEKPDEGLFSFPPPRVTGYAPVDPARLMNPDAATDFAYVADRLANALRRAGYTEDKYRFFWNDRNEFAIVTAMERVNKDGTPLGLMPDGTRASDMERWNSTGSLPRADGVEEYFYYLFSGKRVFYRVYAFVVTPKKYRRNFYSNTAPDFTMAVNWMKKGESQLGDGEATSIEFVPFTNEYSCYALLYLFVNHTSLDGPKSVDALDGENAFELRDGLDLTTENHLSRSRINFDE